MKFSVNDSVAVTVPAALPSAVRPWVHLYWEGDAVQILHEPEKVDPSVDY